MSTIYLPNEVTNGQCASIYSSDIIRVYDDFSLSDLSHSYTDYYVNDHYIDIHSSSSHDVSEVICIDVDNFTTNYWYRNDMPSILLMSFLIIFISLFIIGFICRTFFRGLFK